MRNKLVIVVCSLVAALGITEISPSRAGDKLSFDPPTFSNDIRPILENNCQSCHDLPTFRKTRRWSKSIVRGVRPGASASELAFPEPHKEARHVLTEREVDTLFQWMSTGMARRPWPVSSSSDWQRAESEPQSTRRHDPALAEGPETSCSPDGVDR